MIQQQHMIEEKMNNMKDQVTGTFKVGLSNFFALNKVPKLLRLFKKKYPNVEFELVTGRHASIVIKSRCSPQFC
ncbi:LysR substrate-binding domain-containing protein [Oceanobacillus piezotolerans]|uniref:LysR substrate-binding domain-containing protein n=1 Tax=Oceanobacillus piezotolerans TaxID=2448030 RepID=UPI001FEB7A1D|nr:LysR substrate-binding domain-containing protein [Oceanobacillus piezotolerans]